MIDIVAAAVAAHICDASFIVVAGGHAGIAVEAGMALTGVHELLEVGILAGGGWGHAVVGVGGVGWERGRWDGGLDELRLSGRRRMIVILSEIVHRWAYACGSSFRCFLFFWLPV